MAYTAVAATRIPPEAQTAMIMRRIPRVMAKAVADRFLPVNERAAAAQLRWSFCTRPTHRVLRNRFPGPIDKTKDEVLQKSVFSYLITTSHGGVHGSARTTSTCADTQ